MIDAGTLPRGLWYRLAVFPVQVPPLRDRPEDIPALATHFARTFGATIRHRPMELSQAAIDRLCAHDWPGNVRELENAIERAVVLAASDTLEADDFRDVASGGAHHGTSAHGVPPYHDALEALKRDLVLRAIDHTGGNITAAAKLLALHPNYLHRLMRNLEIRPALRRIHAGTD
jgi:DNA-binding NtrC family response regulator